MTCTAIGNKRCMAEYLEFEYLPCLCQECYDNPQRED